MRHKATVEQINRSAAAARSAMGSDPGGQGDLPSDRHRTATAPDDDGFLDHYFKRIDPQVAASFTPAQQQAIKTMFGTRGINRHAVDIRRGLSFGRSRFYMVFLMGREHRALGGSARPGLRSFVGYLFLALLLLVPIFAAVYLLKVLTGIDVLAAGNLQSGVLALQEAQDLPQM
ncbi:MAG: hypothetical protein OEU09_00805 [Rhodospirillales bacterium]|nr:hypothetical protein [Rhodospirillales bacterium]MDH3793245.1 hypothetical protein [Rhodospirillales bacterium]MDH3909802.1 hypothetical protein [Rhodospirillales bacterium]MDH3918939.1 hypothetical protein [Rhodospirillales bacterium]MDH3968680.1 hypothetical protein [Rhodospirillales bacterium]